MTQSLIQVTDPLSVRSKPSPTFYTETTFAIDNPDHALNWLQQMTPANVKHLARLRIFVHAVYPAAVGQSLLPASDLFTDQHPWGPTWRTLFRKLAAEAVGLREIYIYWDAEPTCWHFGGGADASVVQALAQINSLQKLTIDGFFAKEWPAYLEKKTGLKVWDPKGQEGWYLRELQKFQRGIKDLDVV